MIGYLYDNIIESINTWKLENVQSLVSEIKSENIVYYFIHSCQDGYLEIAKWFYLMKEFSEDEYNEAFSLCCSSNRIDVAEWLSNLEQHVHKINFDKALEYSCQNGFLDISKWLVYVKGANIRNNNVIISALISGNLELSKWIYSFGNIDIHVNNDCIFKENCYSGNIDVIEWLCDICDRFNIKTPERRFEIAYDISNDIKCNHV